MEYRSLLQQDYRRYDGRIDPYIKKYLFLLRITQCSENRIMKVVFHYLLKRHRLKRGIEIDSNVSIGSGLFIAHPFNITINDVVVIGANCNIYKGSLIGQENRGKRKGTPVIGNSVWIGINSCIVGNV